jgi:hypothetical protein
VEGPRPPFPVGAGPPHPRRTHPSTQEDTLDISTFIRLLKPILVVILSSIDTGTVAGYLANLALQLLDKFQGPAGRFMATKKVAPRELPELPPQPWTEETVKQWAEARVAA